MRLFQYQVKAEPVSTSTETITPDKWLGSSEVPRNSWARKTALAAVVLAANTAFAFTPAPPFPEAVSIDRWHPITEKPRWDLKRNQHLYPSFFIGDVPRAEVVPIDRWHPEIEKPSWDLKRQQYTSPSLFYADIPRAENVTVDRWHPEIDKPPASAKRNQYLYPYLSWNERPLDSVTLDSWFVQAVDRQERKQVTITESTAFVYPIEVAPVTVPFDWQIRNADLRRGVPRRIFESSAFVYPVQVAPAAVPFDWQIQSTEPSRKKARIIAESLAFVHPVGQIPFDWHSQYPEPFGRKPRTAEHSSFVYPVVSVAAPFDWQAQQPDPIRLKAFLRGYPYGEIGNELPPPPIVTVDMWNPAQVFIRQKPVPLYWLRYGEIHDVIPGVRLPCIVEANAVLVQPIGYEATLVQPVEYSPVLVQPVSYEATPVQPVEYDATLIQPVDYEAEESCE